MEENLSSKHIWDFKEGDTIYIQAKVKGHNEPHLFLCHFKKLIRNTVYGKVVSIDVNPEMWKNKIEQGLEVYSTFTKCALYGKGKNEQRSFYHWFNTMGYAYKDLDYEETEKRISHPSFGMVGLSRRSSSGVNPLFGSNIQHQNVITLTIKTAELERSLNNDWYFGKKELIQIDMSGSQFSDLITSFNMGDGIPCTIRDFNGSSFPDPPYINPVDVFQREFESKMKNLGIQTQSVVEDAMKMLKEKQTINKGDREFIVNAIQSIITEVSSNIPFISQQFIESMEKTVSQAKNEVETFVTNKIHSLGVEQAKQNPALFAEGIPNFKKIENNDEK